MIEGKAEDILWIVSYPGGAPSGTMILGLPLLRRAVLAAERAGFGRILVEETAAGGVRSLVAETRARVLGRMDSVPDLGSGRLVVLSGSVIPQVRWLRDLRQKAVEPRRLVLDPGCAAVLETNDLRGAVSILRQRGARAPFDALSALFPAAAPLPPSGERFEITGAQDLGRAEDWLLQSLIKETEGFMSRHVERRISLALSRRLASTRVTPNAMTLVSVAVGLAGAGLFLSSRPGVELVGALLVLAHSILDGCDGELARLKFQESRFGGVMDFWGDNVVHSALFGAIAAEWSRSAGEGWPLLLGAAAIVGTLLSAVFVYRHTMAQVREGPLFTSVSREPGSPFSRMADALARRDFLYLLVLLTLLGKSHWFLALAAGGSPIYFLLLLAIAGAGRRRHAAQGAAARAGAVSQ
jgi:1L-myo-inositol 1-phosphate cytidylyltransferase / CDP-L-myo-inositol myo-inositolphosphotransferase